MGHRNTYISRVLFAGGVLLIELDDGKILTGKPDQFDIFDGKNPWVFRFRFSQQNQSSGAFPGWRAPHPGAEGA